jgi:amino acid permease
MKYSCSGVIICTFCIQLTAAVLAIIFGVLIACKPRKTIDIQAALYRPFNWRLEPIDMQKEIRNTRIMGLVVAIMGIIALACVLLS